MTTLVMIDDDETFRELMSRRLEREGFRVAAFASVEAAEACEAAEVNVVLLDLMLGAESSLGAIERLNRRFRPSQLVVLTGYASIATTVEAMKRGATNYLAKPVALSQLLAVLTDDTAPVTAPTPSARRMTPAELEWEHIQGVLLEHEGNISLTARALGMHRRTLQRKLKKHSPF